MRVFGCEGPRSLFLPGVHHERKSQIVQVLKSLGWLTGMTGHGVNDAPALAVAV